MMLIFLVLVKEIMEERKWVKEEEDILKEFLRKLVNLIGNIIK